MAPEKYPCVILCGGRSKRFGSNKLSALLGGKPLLHHVMERASPQCAELALNNLHQDMWLGENVQNLMDDMPNMGPLSGVLTAMKWAKERGYSRVFTTPADTPFLPYDWAAKLSNANANTIAIPQVQDQHHRVSALWPTALDKELQEFLQAGDTYKVGVFLASHPVQYIPFPAHNVQDPFFNINTREDMKRAELVNEDKS